MGVDASVQGPICSCFIIYLKKIAMAGKMLSDTTF